jgi:hypothetical protein
MMAAKKLNGISPDEQQVTFVIKTKQKERLDHIAWYERRKKKEVEQEAVALYLESKKHIPEKQ